MQQSSGLLRPPVQTLVATSIPQRGMKRVLSGIPITKAAFTGGFHFLRERENSKISMQQSSGLLRPPVQTLVAISIPQRGMKRVLSGAKKSTSSGEYGDTGNIKITAEQMTKAAESITLSAALFLCMFPVQKQYHQRCCRE